MQLICMWYASACASWRLTATKKYTSYAIHFIFKINMCNCKNIMHNRPIDRNCNWECFCTAAVFKPGVYVCVYTVYAPEAINN